jgi:hypothetical protein
MMTEYELISSMHLAFTQNAIYFLCMTILTWIAFNLANGIRIAVNRGDTVRNIAKIFLSIFCVFVGFFFLNVSLIGGGILDSYATALSEVESTAGDRLSALSTSPGSIGSSLQILFHVFIVIFQLTMIWFPKPK